MSYQVLARKWRPAKFSEVVGQQHVVQALTNAMESGRLHHAYLLTGTRGVGKTTLGRILAKSLNCEQGQSAEPCGVCSACQEIDQGRFVDLIEIDAASRTKVEDTREILDNVQYRPTRGQYKVYLIDEVHMLSRHSFNALLKTLEEPPPHVKFLLATTDPQKLPVTILSRCLQFNLKAMTVEQIIGQLQFILGEENIRYEMLAVEQIARAAQGSMRDALSLTDQAIAHGQGQLTDAQVTAMLGLIDRDYVRALVQGLLSGDAESLMAQVAVVAGFAPDYDKLLSSLQSLVHRASLVALAPAAIADHEPERELLQQLATHWAPEQLQLAYQILVQGRRDLPFSPDGRSALEMILLRILMFRPMQQIDLPKHQLVSPAVAVAPVSNSADRVEHPIANAASSAPETSETVEQVPEVSDSNEQNSSAPSPLASVDTADADKPAQQPSTAEASTDEINVANQAEQSSTNGSHDSALPPAQKVTSESADVTPEQNSVATQAAEVDSKSDESISPPAPPEHVMPEQYPADDLADMFAAEPADLASLEAQQAYVMEMAEDQGFNSSFEPQANPVEANFGLAETPAQAPILAPQAEDSPVEPRVEQSSEQKTEQNVETNIEPSAEATETVAPQNSLQAPPSGISAMLSARNQLRSQIKKLESDRASGAATPVKKPEAAAPSADDQQSSAQPIEQDGQSVAEPVDDAVDVANATQATQTTEATEANDAPSSTIAEVVEPASQAVVSQEQSAPDSLPESTPPATDDDPPPWLTEQPTTEPPTDAVAEQPASAEPEVPVVTAAPGEAGKGQVKSWWEQLIDTLGFDALKRQLALDCVLEPVADGYCLRVPTKAKHLATDANISILLERIHSYVGLSTVIEVVHEASIDSETPRQAQGRRAEERQKEAEQTIANDPIVRQLQDTFDATVDQDTIRPI
ncbi:DNA polymerase III subunit gamma/tau [Neiella sp. HB171785]|uniref:DNA-directed DNA polymerase n=1 Tax=Neiella litorisoli TaxID=2771431 RepID=A0A8J6UIK8_9GAMM|nr:DNA polymerase III subunit gamma/tau [Neiella litorisoli]MBD1388593.1 DNA polymerase III subunit gamma/tau [Neiella litorisoli]